MKVAPYIQKLTPGLRPKYPKLETELLDWFKESRSQLKVVTHYMIQAKACSFTNRAVYQDMYTNINAAKFSQKWVDGFMTHHNLVNRRKTTVAQWLPDDYIELQNSFLSYILYQRKENQYPLSLIANMDETPLSFNLPNSTTIEQRDTKTVSILSNRTRKIKFHHCIRLFGRWDEATAGNYF